MPDKILPLYGIQPINSKIDVFGDGLINRTWKVTTNSTAYILQQINQSVFKKPTDIDLNISNIKSYLNDEYPEYLFVSPVSTSAGKTIVETPEGFFRLTPFVENSHTVNVLAEQQEAYEAAKQFGRFSRLLNSFDVSKLQITLYDFHNLDLRYKQFCAAVASASPEKKKLAQDVIDFSFAHEDIVFTYNFIVAGALIPQRVIHHDTKISNVLFDTQKKGICVIDLDTVMPGYFISDVGDMMRTYLCAASEEETDFSKIGIRTEFFKAIYDGYMSEMGDVLTETEKSYFTYSGKFLIYMQGLRFLTDYLQDNIYYGEQYPGHNLNRAINQMTLLKKYLEKGDEFAKVIQGAQSVS